MQTLAEVAAGLEVLDMEAYRYCEKRVWREVEGKRSCSWMTRETFRDCGWICWKREEVRTLRIIIVRISLVSRTKFGKIPKNRVRIEQIQ